MVIRFLCAFAVFYCGFSSFAQAEPEQSPNLESATPLASPSPADAEEPQKTENHSIHFQGTVVPQAHPAITSPYEGTESVLRDPELNVSFSSTIFLGYQVFPNTELYFNPEFIAGGGISNAYGFGAYPNGEINRVGSSGLQTNVARLYVSQTIPLGDETEFVTDDLNQIAGKKANHYVRFSLGKYSIADFFDSNTYAHDQRTQFLNFCFMDNCAWDYAMNPIGYIYAFTTELNEKEWALRFVAAMEPTVVNGADMDTNILQAHSLTLEYERHYTWHDHPGALRLLAFYNRNRAQDYASAVIQLTLPGAGSPDAYHNKYGGGVNIEQELTKDLGGFMRVGANDGQSQSFTFTEDDFTLTAGLSLSGKLFHRDQDTIGLATGINELTRAHSLFLGAGGEGLMLGDGKLNYGPEEFTEIYYSYEIPKAKNLFLSPDIQYVINPGFNADRGPVAIFAIRLHYELGGTDWI